MVARLYRFPIAYFPFALFVADFAGAALLAAVFCFGLGVGFFGLVIFFVVGFFAFAIHCPFLKPVSAGLSVVINKQYHYILFERKLQA